VSDDATGLGRIVLVGTPIGNLGDLSPRAAAALAGADVIYCEDTRRTRTLLSAAGIPAPKLAAMHEHNEAVAADAAVRAATGGAVVAVVSDAGLPAISDPGRRVVEAAQSAGVAVEVVPGPSAGLTALVASGLPTGRFCFEGFLPRSGSSRAAALSALAGEARTTVLYEAPHRVARTLADLARACGDDREVAVGRELTKIHEQHWRGTLGQAVEWVAGDPPRGEWVIVLGGAGPASVDPPSEEAVRVALVEALRAGSDKRGAVAAVAAALGVPKRVAYQVAVGLDPGSAL
jgi:16S rRNA (cytidine1402-2'-O)-methyltransferase